MTLKPESRRATKLLKGKLIGKVLRYGRKGVLIECSDGTRFFVDWVSNGLDLSIT
jgi:hypothetical protein